MSTEASVASASNSPFFASSSSQSYNDIQPSVSTSHYSQMQYPSSLICGMQSQYFNPNQLQPPSGPGAYQSASRQPVCPSNSLSSSSTSTSAFSFLDDLPQSHASCSSLFLSSPLPMPLPCVSTPLPPALPHSSAHQQTTAMDSCQQISHVLQCYQTGGEDREFVKKAIESLVKKLKDKRQELDSLITAITTAGKQPTGCVTIQRSLDGRLQVAGRKGVPHVVYARIWRWPNVNKNELVKHPQCTTPTDDSDFICVNPYHLIRTPDATIPNPGQMQNQSMGVTPNQVKEDYGGAALEFETTHNMNEHLQQNSQQPCSYQVWTPNNCAMTSHGNEIYPSSNNFIPSSQQSQQGHTNDCQVMDLFRYDLAQVHIPATSHVPDYWCSIIYYELDTEIGETFKVRWEMPEVLVDGGMDPQGEKSGRFCLGALSNIHRGEASEKARIHIGNGLQLQHLPDGSVILRSLSRIFIQSGYLDFCDGVPYGSKVHRFTDQSPITTIFDLRWAYKEMLTRTRSTSEALRAQAAAVAGYAHGNQLAAHLPSMMADSGVDGMRSAFCTIKVSFVKGWGERYPRKAIKETPCWIEIQLHRPLQLLDQLLKSSGSL